MSALATSLAVLPAAVVRLAEEGGKKTYESPGPADFSFTDVFGAHTYFTKIGLIVVVMTAVVGLFYFLSARNAQVVPGKLQFAGESLYGFVRNSIAIDSIGHEGLKFVPYLATLFSFVAVNNLAGIIPFLQIPSTSKLGIPIFLALISWAIFNYVGMKRVGVGTYFKNMMFPPGIPIPVYFLLAPIELFSTFFVRPITLALRLTFNMFAGHLVLLLFVSGGTFLLTETQGVVGYGAGAISILGSIVLTFFEAFVQLLQAYVFTLLSALYIAGAMADEH